MVVVEGRRRNALGGRGREPGNVARKKSRGLVERETSLTPQRGRGGWLPEK